MIGDSALASPTVTGILNCHGLMTRPTLTLGAAALLAVIPAAASTPFAAAQQPPRTPAHVTNIVDGDTISVTIAAQPHRVRYIGVDTPERGHSYWMAATDANRALVADRDVLLEKDVSETDRYGRLLRHVFLPDAGVGEVFVSAELVRQGLARVATTPPDVRYADMLVAIERDARLARRILWTGLLFMPAVGRIGWCVDLNTATLEELQLIIHIGPVSAEEIIRGRPWRSVDELIRISGIGESRLADIKREGLACVGGQAVD